MCEERKRYLSGLKKLSAESEPCLSVSKHAPPKEEHKETKPGRASSPPKKGGADERRSFLKAIAAQKKCASGPSSSEGGSVRVVERDEAVAFIDFSLSSLESFLARGALARGDDVQHKMRKRPHYDNRLRALNKKFTSRLSYLS